MVTKTEQLLTRNPQRLVIRVAMVLVVFFSGILIGSGGTLVHLRNRLTRVQLQSSDSAAIVAARIQRKHHLTDPQTQRVEQALAKRIGKAIELRQQFLAQRRVVEEKFQADLKKALPPEKYKLLKRQLDAKRKWRQWFLGTSEESQENLPAVPLPEPEQE